MAAALTLLAALATLYLAIVANDIESFPPGENQRAPGLRAIPWYGLSALAVAAATAFAIVLWSKRRRQWRTIFHRHPAWLLGIALASVVAWIAFYLFGTIDVVLL